VYLRRSRTWSGKTLSFPRFAAHWLSITRAIYGTGGPLSKSAALSLLASHLPVTARPNRRGDRISAPAASWCDPAGESPAQVRGSVLLGSECCVATGDSGCEAYTAIAWGVGLSHERSDVAGAEGFYSLEGNMCGTAMRGAVALPGSKATSRAKGSHRKLGGLVSDRQRRMRGTVRIGKARSRSR
jgi:hypothetical protein